MIIFKQAWANYALAKFSSQMAELFQILLKANPCFIFLSMSMFCQSKVHSITPLHIFTLIFKTFNVLFGYQWCILWDITWLKQLLQNHN